MRGVDNQHFSYSGIYKITNLSTGKLYIGSAYNIDRRLARHKNYLKQNIHPNKHLQASYNRYGSTFFIGDCLEKVTDKKELLTKEQYWIDLARTEEVRLYNLAPVAGKPINILSNESRKKISETLKKKGIKPPSRKDIGYGYCKLYCPKGHYKTSEMLIHGSNACKECQRIKSQIWRLTHNYGR